MAHVDRPPPLGYRRCALSSWHIPDRVCIEKMGPMQSHGMRTKYLSRVQNPGLILQKRPARRPSSEDSNMLEVTEQIPSLRRNENIRLNLKRHSSRPSWPMTCTI